MTPNEPTDGGPGPRVYARLAHDASRRSTLHASPLWARVAGWLIVLAIFAMVVAAAVRVQPWS